MMELYKLNRALFFARIIYLSVCGCFSLFTFLLLANIVGSVITSNTSELPGVVIMAAAVGAGLPVWDAAGRMVVDVGGGTSEVAVISLGDIVTAQSVRIAGDDLDEAIINYVRKKHNLLIGERTAEQIKIEIGSAKPYENETSIEIKGRNQVDGLPKNVIITSEEVRTAMTDPISQIIDTIRLTLEKTPPELAADIIDRGITLTGGGALLRGFAELIAEETGMPVSVAANPLDCVVLGTAKRLEADSGFENYVFRRGKRFR